MTTEKPHKPARAMRYISALIVLLILSFLVYMIYLISTQARESGEHEGQADEPQGSSSMSVYSVYENSQGYITRLDRQYDGATVFSENYTNQDREWRAPLQGPGKVNDAAEKPASSDKTSAILEIDLPVYAGGQVSQEVSVDLVMHQTSMGKAIAFYNAVHRPGSNTPMLTSLESAPPLASYFELDDILAAARPGVWTDLEDYEVYEHSAGYINFCPLIDGLNKKYERYEVTFALRKHNDCANIEVQAEGVVSSY